MSLPLSACDEGRLTRVSAQDAWTQLLSPLTPIERAQLEQVRHQPSLNQTTLTHGLCMCVCVCMHVRVCVHALCFALCVSVYSSCVYVS
jgi:hypothetical protein